MVVVAAGCLVGVDEVGGGVVGCAVDEGGGPGAVVEQGVVVLAEEGGVVDVGFAAVVPGFDVVGFGPGGDGGAVGERAAEVAGEEYFALGGCEEALGAVGVEDGGSVAQGQGGDLWVAEVFGEEVQGLGAVVGGEGGAAAVAAFEVSFGGGDDELGFQSAVQRQGSGAGGEVHAGEEPVEELLGAGAVVFDDRVGVVRIGGI